MLKRIIGSRISIAASKRGPYSMKSMMLRMMAQKWFAVKYLLSTSSALTGSMLYLRWLFLISCGIHREIGQCYSFKAGYSNTTLFNVIIESQCLLRSIEFIRWLNLNWIGRKSMSSRAAANSCITAESLQANGRGIQWWWFGFLFFCCTFSRRAEAVAISLTGSSSTWRRVGVVVYKIRSGRQWAICF